MSLDAYFEAAKQLGPNPFYERVRPFLPVVPGRVLEIGFGVGAGVRWWADQGWQVTGIDPDPRMCDEAARRCEEYSDVKICCADGLTAAWPKVDVIAAVFATFFLGDREGELLARIQGHLEPGGLFVGQLLGPNDNWAATMPSHTTAQLRDWLEPFDVLFWDEVEADGKTVYGEPKHWHVHHLILRLKTP